MRLAGTLRSLRPAVPSAQRWCAGVPADDGPDGARAISMALVLMTERYFYRASKGGTSLADAPRTLTDIWLAILPS